MCENQRKKLKERELNSHRISYYTLIRVYVCRYECMCVNRNITHIKICKDENLPSKSPICLALAELGILPEFFIALKQLFKGDVH